jgi:Ca-activated chloride channel family protein
MIEFQWPWVALLLPLPFLVYRLVRPAQLQMAALYVPDIHSYEVTRSDLLSNTSKRRLHAIVLVLSWILLLLAAAQPRWIGDAVSLPTSGRDLVLAVDISGSMQKEDMLLNGNPVDRLTLVKQVVSDFVDKRKGDRLGLILFGTRAYLQTPLSFDRQTLQQLLNEAQIGFAGEKTAIGDAIGLAIKRLQNRPEQNRVVILLTDGANTAGEVKPLQAARLAAQSGVTVYTVGIGADEMIRPGLFGSAFGSRRTNPSADLDEETLQEIAKLTSGKYYRAKNREELKEIYALLDKLEPIEQEAETYRPIKSLFYWPLSVALCLAGLLIVMNFPLRDLLAKEASNNPEAMSP